MTCLMKKYVDTYHLNKIIEIICFHMQQTCVPTFVGTYACIKYCIIYIVTRFHYGR